MIFMKKILILFFIVLNVTFGANRLSRITKLEYDKENNLIKIVEFNGEKSKIHEIEYVYDNQNRILKYMYNGKEEVFFKYNENGQIEQIKNYYGIYNFSYEKGVVKFYNLINDRNDSGRYYIISKDPIFELSQYDFLITVVNRNGKITLLKPSSERFNYSNSTPNIKTNKNGDVIEKRWGSKKDSQNNIKYFTYDSNGNLIEVKSIEKIKVVRSFVEGIGYIFSIMLHGYSI